MKFDVVIGLEVHARLLTNTKVFCSCAARYGDRPNTNVCPTCIGLPGGMPALNYKAVELAVRAALALGCEISPSSSFARKNYFYPDLPKGYQITQYSRPLALRGHVTTQAEGKDRSFPIARLHIEEDAGKSTCSTVNRASLVDFNRAGIPLVEIVSEPSIHSSNDAVSFVRALRQILMYIGVCDGNMENGSLRCDGNLSLREATEDTLGAKVELKNMNSLRHLKAALEYEVKRQTAALEAGGSVALETRQWNERTRQTEVLRSKEDASDYRYFPEPDLPELRLDRNWIDAQLDALPELPADRRRRFQKELDLPPYDVQVLTASKPLADYYEAILVESVGARLASGFVMTEVLRADGESGTREFTPPIPAREVAGLLSFIESGMISRSMARTVFEKMRKTGKKAESIIEAEGLTQVSDPKEIDAACAEVITGNKKQLAQYREGKTSLLDFFVGRVMKTTRGRADPELVNKTMRRMLDE